MTIKTLHGPIDCKEFKSQFIDKNVPVIVKRYGENWTAVKEWNADYFKNRFGHENIKTKKFLGNDKILIENIKLDDYIFTLKDYEKSFNLGLQTPRPAYWHDVPIFQIFKELLADVDPFQAELLPVFYQRDWSQYVQFFMSASGSVTKLHFDTLRTNNLFFQIQGTKKWTILPPSEEQLCGRKHWRWFGVDPESPDFGRFPEYKNAHPISFIVEPGDLLFIPSGTLHHVRSLDFCISFNIDFHTKSSVINSFRYIYKGMPLKVIGYNLVSFLGLVIKIPSKLLFPLYKSYLNYVS